MRSNSRHRWKSDRRNVHMGILDSSNGIWMKYAQWMVLYLSWSHKWSCLWIDRFPAPWVERTDFFGKYDEEPVNGFCWKKKTNRFWRTHRIQASNQTILNVGYFFIGPFSVSFAEIQFILHEFIVRTNGYRGKWDLWNGLLLFTQSECHWLFISIHPDISNRCATQQERYHEGGSPEQTFTPMSLLFGEITNAMDGGMIAELGGNSTHGHRKTVVVFDGAIAANVF